MEDNPLFVDGPGANFELTSESPAIDAGIVVDDFNGAYVESLCAGCGWGNLDFQGDAPDIGAIESPYTAATSSSLVLLIKLSSSVVTSPYNSSLAS